MARECGKKLSARGSPSCTSAATTTGMRVALAALVCVLACMPAVLGAFPKKRTYDSHHYYVAELVQRDPCSAQVTPEHVARALDAELVERVGELEGHWLLRAEKADAIARRSVLARCRSRTILCFVGSPRGPTTDMRSDASAHSV